MAYVWVLPGLHLPLVFEMYRSRTLIFCLWHGWVGSVGKFGLLFPSRGNPLNGTCKFRTLSETLPQRKVSTVCRQLRGAMKADACVAISEPGVQDRIGSASGALSMIGP